MTEDQLYFFTDLEPTDTAKVLCELHLGDLKLRMTRHLLLGVLTLGWFVSVTSSVEFLEVSTCFVQKLYSVTI